VVGRLRSLNLTVEKYESSDRKSLYLKVSGNDAMLKYEAQEKKLRCKLKGEHGGAQCGYSMVRIHLISPLAHRIMLITYKLWILTRAQELDEKGAYDKPCDGFAVFNSSQQLKMLLSVSTCGQPSQRTSLSPSTRSDQLTAL
jgi:hypothetical protein